MIEKFQNKYRIPTNRFQGYDYGAHGLYFVTICTKDKIHYFGEITVETCDCTSQNNETRNSRDETRNCASLRTTAIGQIAIDFWKDIPKHYPFVALDEFIVMPNHIHGILFFNRPDKTDWNENKFGIQSRNLAAIIRAYKSSVKRYANQNGIEFEWQSRFHDRIIRDREEWSAIKEYIINNPEKWNNDELNS